MSSPIQLIKLLKTSKFGYTENKIPSDLAALRVIRGSWREPPLARANYKLDPHPRPLNPPPPPPHGSHHSPVTDVVVGPPLNPPSDSRLQIRPMSARPAFIAASSPRASSSIDSKERSRDAFFKRKFILECLFLIDAVRSGFAEQSN